MKRFAIVAVLVLSPLNGLWAFCPSPSSGDATADECQRICALHRSDKSCSVLPGDAVVWPAAGVTSALMPASLDPVARTSLAERLPDVVADLRDQPVTPLLPPPKA